MATRTAVSARPLTSSVGSVIDGLDLRKRLDDETIAEIREVLLDRGVVFFPRQEMTGGQLHDFVSRFGRPIHIDYFGKPGEDTFETPCGRDEIVSGSLTPSRKSTAIWHSDITWIPRPPAFTALRAVEVPGVGGDTCWADMEAAWEALSEPMRAMLEGLTAIHSMRPTVEREGLVGHQMITERKVELVESIHPVVTTHPETGRKALYVSECSTLRIVELAPLESMQVLAALFLHIRSPDFAVRWHWSPGDLAFWDNRSTQHYAVPDYEEERVMQRIELAGERPRGS